MAADAQRDTWEPGAIPDQLGRHRAPRQISTPRALILESFHLEHPDPASLAPVLDALGADAEIRPAAAPALVAHLRGPKGTTVLR